MAKLICISLALIQTSVVTIPLFIFPAILIQFLKKICDLDFNVDFVMTNVYKFFITAQHYNTGSAWFVCKKNRG